MHMCDLSSVAPDPAQYSVVWYTKVLIQNMKVFPKMSEKSMLEAKRTDGIRPRIKQLHIFVIKHRVMCGDI